VHRKSELKTGGHRELYTNNRPAWFASIECSQRTTRKAPPAIAAIHPERRPFLLVGRAPLFEPAVLVPLLDADSTEEEPCVVLAPADGALSPVVEAAAAVAAVALPIFLLGEFHRES
jgi:hypothetical protein